MRTLTTSLCFLALAGALSAQQPNTAAGGLKINGFDGNVYPLFLNVPSNTVMEMTFDGAANMPFACFFSPTSVVAPGSAVFFNDI